MTGNPIRSLKGHDGKAPCTCLDPWETDDACPMTGHSGAVKSVAFSPIGDILASGSADATIRIWDARRNQLRSLTGHSGPVLCLAFRQDGLLTVLLSEFGTFHLGQDRPWDDVSGQLWDPSHAVSQQVSGGNAFRFLQDKIHWQWGLYTRKSGRNAMCGPTDPYKGGDVLPHSIPSNAPTTAPPPCHRTFCLPPLLLLSRCSHAYQMADTCSCLPSPFFFHQSQ